MNLLKDSGGKRLLFVAGLLLALFVVMQVYPSGEKDSLVTGFAVRDIQPEKPIFKTAVEPETINESVPEEPAPADTPSVQQNTTEPPQQERLLGRAASGGGGLSSPALPVPSIVDAQVNPTSVAIPGRVNISALITSPFGIDAAWLQVTKPDLSTHKVNLSSSGDAFAVIYNTTNTGSYSAIIIARDGLGQMSVSAPLFWTSYANTPLLTIATALNATLINLSQEVSITATLSQAANDVYAILTTPENSTTNLTLFETSALVYAADYLPATAGTYQLQVIADRVSGKVLYFYVQNASTPIDLPPTVQLLLPVDRGGSTAEMITFDYAATDDVGISTCTLYIDGTENATNSGQPFTAMLPKGSHTWKVSCTDTAGKSASSPIYTIYVIPGNRFSGRTTDLRKVNIRTIQDMLIENPKFGLINFTGQRNLEEVGAFDDHITIGKNFIQVDTENVPALDGPATLSLYDLGLQRPVILRDGEPCLDCSVKSYLNGDLVFSVPHFSSYTASENSQLRIWDQTDHSTMNASEQIIHYANYTNTTSKNPIATASCNITFDDGSADMIYNATLQLFTYNRTYASAGNHPFEIICDGTATGYTLLSTIDYVSINNDDGPLSPSNLTVVESNRRIISSSNKTNEAYAGNMTELRIDGTMVSQSWQGYYGNVSGTIVLDDSDGSSLYDWPLNNPTGEVYATRALDVNFVDINCSNSSQISAEVSALGQSTGSAESVNRTFNESTHPSFMVGTASITTDSCASLNTYVSDAPQNANFHEVLLSDGASNTLYVAILDDDTTGFDGALHDFQMLVGEDGHGNTATTTYYFFIEIE